MMTLEECVIRDLREFSEDLLGVGLSQRTRNPGALHTPPGTSGRLVGAVGTLSRLLPTLIAELPRIRSEGALKEILIPIPIRAEVSRRPSDYQRVGDRILPKRFVTLVPDGNAVSDAVRWLTHLLVELRGQIQSARARTGKRVTDALVAKRGTSAWALTDRFALERMDESLMVAEAALDRSILRLAGLYATKFQPSARPPSPYPVTRAWVALRRMADALLNPQTTLPERVVDLLTGSEAAADLPFLYQRWVGIRIVQALRTMGWNTRDDPAGAIFLGGRLTFQKGHAQFDLWVEPRFSSKTHECGFRSVGDQESTPDFMFITPGAGGIDGFILDATLNSEGPFLMKKGSYINRIEREGIATFAGCPVVKRPLVAWSAAPFSYRANRMLTRDGTIGAIPMQPTDYEPRPLIAWLSEITRRAVAWTNQNPLSGP
ncbi:MAG TPA: hypothetical protein PKA37_00335 [Planctomycetota bacterium]|nr:hypothetical protein [Planctomycetota bacterium]